MIYHLGTDIMVMGNGHPCMQYIIYIIRTVAIYFNSYFHKLILNNTQTILFSIKLVQTYSYWVMCMHIWVSNIYIIRSIAIYCISLFYNCYITKFLYVIYFIHQFTLPITIISILVCCIMLYCKDSNILRYNR